LIAYLCVTKYAVPVGFAFGYGTGMRVIGRVGSRDSFLSARFSSTDVAAAICDLATPIFTLLRYAFMISRTVLSSIESGDAPSRRKPSRNFAGGMNTLFANALVTGLAAAVGAAVVALGVATARAVGVVAVAAAEASFGGLGTIL